MESITCKYNRAGTPGEQEREKEREEVSNGDKAYGEVLWKGIIVLKFRVENSI